MVWPRIMPRSNLVSLNSEWCCNSNLQSLLSNVAFGFGCAYLAHYEESGEGATWANIWTSPLLGTGDRYSMAGAIGMLLVDSVLYGVLTWYVEAVFPGEFGVPKPW